MNPDGIHRTLPDHSIEIRRANPDDFHVIGELARQIWRASFPGMVTPQQIEYMLSLRYTPEAMARAVMLDGLSFELLRVDRAALAFAAHGPTQDPAELKLQQLYVHPEWQGRGLGGCLLDHVEVIARGLGRSVIVLTVNRHNSRAKAVYEHRGFTVRSEAQFDIGGGFVMDDYVMEKRLLEPA